LQLLKIKLRKPKHPWRLLMIFCLLMGIAGCFDEGCGHHVLSKDFISFSTDKQLPDGLYATEPDKNDSIVKPDFMPQLKGIKNSQRLLLNIMQGKNGMKRVELVSCMEFIDTSEKTPVTRQVYWPFRLSDEVLISHIASYDGLDYYHFSAKLIDPIRTIQPKIPQKFFMSLEKWRTLSPSQKYTLAEKLARHYQNDIKAYQWSSAKDYSPENPYHKAIANFVFAYDPAKQSLHFLDQVFSKGEQKNRCGPAEQQSALSLEMSFDNEAKYKTWMVERVKGRPERADEMLLFKREQDSPGLLRENKPAVGLYLLAKMFDKMVKQARAKRLNLKKAQ
jgi:hypothetical protein